MSEWQKRTAAALREQLGLMGQRDVPSNRDGFDDEFDALRALDHRVRANHDEFYTALLGSNMSKNRFGDILPNEATRVALDPVNARGDGDYINANYLDGRRLFGVPFVYIATQAPLQSSVGDFWRMVYENNTVYVVMLCAEIENGKVKSERYWPDGVGGVLNVGPLTLILSSENHRADTIFRGLTLRTADGKERQIFHMQYSRWPDQGIPQSSAPLMELIHALGRAPNSTQTPIVVHCSGGVGRTGVFLTLHIALALFQLERPISIPRIVQLLKYCRSGMVQRKDQYLFAYYAVLREAEKMIWAAESAHRHFAGPAAASSSPLRNAALLQPTPAFAVTAPPGAARRPNQHVPQHPAQARAELPRSSLQFGDSGHFGGGGDGRPRGWTPAGHWQQQQPPAPEHGIRAMDSAAFGPTVASLNFSRLESLIGVGSGAGATAFDQPQFGPGSEVELALRSLQARNQSVRGTPKSLAAAPGPISEPWRRSSPTYQPPPPPPPPPSAAAARLSLESSTPASIIRGTAGDALPPVSRIPTLNLQPAASRSSVSPPTASSSAAPTAAGQQQQQQRSATLSALLGPDDHAPLDGTQRPFGTAAAAEPRSGYFFDSDTRGGAAAAAAAPSRATAPPATGGASDLADASRDFQSSVFGSGSGNGNGAGRRPGVVRGDLSLL